MIRRLFRKGQNSRRRPPDTIKFHLGPEYFLRRPKIERKMPREKLISSDDDFREDEDGTPLEDDIPMRLNIPQDVADDDSALRPTRINDMVGQRDVYERILISIDAASKRREPLGHILFDGPPGLGKTTFATCIPRELGTSCRSPAVRRYVLRKT